jgi:UDP-N-acetylmuramoyl-L-alanyl-D-glutamate--2,6-diaminopimelate ligase
VWPPDHGREESGLRLREVLAEVGACDADGPLDAEVAGIACDSRRVGPGDLFVAVRGARQDGNRFAADAVARGAVAVVSAAPRPAAVAAAAWVRVHDERRAMARAAAAIHRHPDREIPLVGITGTNGKTTTAYLIESILHGAGRRPGVIGTVEHRWPGHAEPASRTTPEAPDLQRMLRRMIEAGCGAAVLEVSSHALDLRRVDGMRFRVAVFTNLTRDHLDHHRDMDAYFAAKAKLFESLRPSDTAVLNAGDPRAAALRARTAARVVTYGHGDDCDVRPLACRTSFSGTTARLRTPAGELAIESSLPGRPNLENVMAAAAAALALGVGPEAIGAGVAGVAGVPGRFERLRAGQPYEVIVDYAHTDDALRNLLGAVRALGPERVITVFGCGGDRDREKRPLMGEAAASGSDAVILTSDNPRGEDPAAIAAAAEAGVRRVIAAGRRIDFEVVLDRRRAIARALDLARPGDAVVIAGKGHEREQILAGRTLPFDDREVCRALLRERAGRGSGG